METEPSLNSYFDNFPTIPNQYVNLSSFNQNVPFPLFTNLALHSSTQVPLNTLDHNS